MANTISDQLNRLIQAKAGIKSALQEKHLTISDSSTLDEYPALILEMEVGGSGVDTSTLIDLIEGDILELVIPEGVTKIGQSAFQNRKQLSSVTIPSNISNIGMNAFAGCSALHSLDLPAACTTIYNGLVRDCVNLEKFVVKAGVTDIWNEAFYNVSPGMSMVMLPTTPPTLHLAGNYIFGGSWPIYVKASAENTYKKAGGNWDNVSTRIQPLAAMDYDSSTMTVTATGRNVELYIDSTLLNSDTYTFDINTETGSHTVMVKSIDASLGVLDTVTKTITVEVSDYPEMQILVPYSFNLLNKNEYVSFTGSLNKVQQNNLTITNNTTISNPSLVTVVKPNTDLTFNTSVGNITYIKFNVSNSNDAYTAITPNSSFSGKYGQFVWEGNSNNVLLRNSSTSNSSIENIQVTIDGIDTLFVEPDVTPIITMDSSIDNLVNVTSNALNNYIYNTAGNMLSNGYFLPNSIVDTSIKLIGCALEYGSGYSKDSSIFNIERSLEYTTGVYLTILDPAEITPNDESGKFIVYNVKDATSYLQCMGTTLLTDKYIQLYAVKLGSSSLNPINKYPAQFRMVKGVMWYLNPCGANMESVVFEIDHAAKNYNGDTNTVSDGNLTWDADTSTLTWSGFTNNDLKTLSTAGEQMRVIKITFNYEIV